MDTASVPTASVLAGLSGPGENRAWSSLPQVTSSKLLVVGIGGTTRAGSSTERALDLALRDCAERGLSTLRLGGEFLAALPHYTPGVPLTDVQQGLIGIVRRADAVILASPSYHGGLSGLLKNALDTLEELSGDERPYLDGRAVGCIVTAYGWQAGGTVLTGLRASAHALRGWPTPYGAVINTLETPLRDPQVPASVATALGRVSEQVGEFARHFHAGTSRVRQAPATIAPRVAVGA
ncbi:NAD(P)H-dependent oxidoreductase [Pseudoxanthomonas sp.]|uniref:NADPH-dependent FMN reductase n=1 Tax=Pseudoxanthomonas sp. TaxID=1871049 RepID=UPI00263629C3|nr:NAD(P)H-dependent oxidoreductase [Pseudoxanthomonas sp.]WDS36532.1 MAG: NAD(P)H-dependent oxidoreductase [Pseudoxanthomonas sp.]